MKIVKQILINPENIKKLLSGTFIAMLVTTCSQLMFSEMKNETLNPTLANYYLLCKDEDMIILFEELINCLKINGTYDETNIHKLCVLYDNLVGVSLLMDMNQQLSFETNYYMQSLIIQIDENFAQLLNYKFKYTKLGVQLCDIIEKFQAANQDIIHNIKFHIREQSL